MLSAAAPLATQAGTPCGARTGHATAASWAASQQALLQLLLAPLGQAGDRNAFIAHHALATPLRGLAAYQANGHALAERALGSAYPVVQQMLGAESFAALARALWHAMPPQCGDVAYWGHALDQFVPSDPQLQNVPYLADVASVEWALHRAAMAADARPNPSSVSLLTTHDPQSLRVRLCPALRVLPSVWPVVSLLHAHGAGLPAHSENHAPNLAHAAAAVQARQAETAVVWRDGWRPQVRQALPHEAALLQALLRGATLGQALDAAPHLDVAAWLGVAVRSGLLCEIELQETP